MLRQLAQGRSVGASRRRRHRSAEGEEEPGEARQELLGDGESRLPPVGRRLSEAVVVGLEMAEATQHPGLKSWKTEAALSGEAGKRHSVAGRPNDRSGELMSRLI